MSRRKHGQRKWISPQDFADLRHQACMTRKQAAEALDVTPRTVQNWETGGARIPWMAYRILRILRGYALPGVDWEGWTVRGRYLFSPAGRHFDAYDLQSIQLVFSQARLWRQMYASRAAETRCKREPPSRHDTILEPEEQQQSPLKLVGGTR